MPGKPDLITTGAMAKKLCVEPWRVSWVLSTRRVEPVMVVGGYRLFDTAAVRQVRDAIREMDRQREAVTT